MKKVYFAIIAMVTFMFGVQAALACSCMMQTAQEYFDGAEKVYIATVKDVETLQDQSEETQKFGGFISKKVATLDILEQFKGEKTVSTVSTSGQSATCGINFEVGETYVIYEDKDSKDAAYSCSGTTNIKYASQEILDNLASTKTTYTSQKVFETLVAPTCEAATDGCNGLILQDGKIVGATKMYCENHTPKYECTKKTMETKTYKTKAELLKAHPKCTSATDGVNTFFGKDLMSSTRIGVPENFVAEWKCLEEEEITMCTMQYDPVCGVDGKTYGNSCTAGKVEIAYEGECSKEDTVKITGEKISTTVKDKIDVIMEKYTDKILKRSVEEQKKINAKITLKVKERAEKYKDTNNKMYNILQYLVAKLDFIQQNIGVKNASNVPDCDGSDSLTQCKK